MRSKLSSKYVSSIIKTDKGFSLAKKTLNLKNKKRINEDTEPVYSGKEVEIAGRTLKKPETLEDKNIFTDAMNVLYYWRNLHEVPMENAFKLLENIVQKHDRKAFVAKRSKRYFSIVRKLNIETKMNLRNMQDIAGCRAIFTSKKKLGKAYNELRKNTVFKKDNGELRVKDYISIPKPSGYRSIHIVGKFSDNNNKNKSVEIQLRTKIQHHWATALEIIDIFTNQALKSNMGNEDWAKIFKQISYQFEIMEKIHLYDNLQPLEQYSKYKKMVVDEKHGMEHGLVIQSIYDIDRLQRKLKVIEQLNAFASSIEVMDKKIRESGFDGYALLVIDPQKGEIASNLFDLDNVKEAFEEYLNVEKKHAKNKDIVVSMVSTNSIGGLPEAYPNYFADSTIFLTNLTYIVNLKNELDPSWIRKALSSMS